MDTATLVALLSGLVSKWPIISTVLASLGALVVVGQALVPVLPSKSLQDEWAKLQAIPLVGTILSVLLNFAPVQKK